jgi:putative phosphoesterase
MHIAVLSDIHGNSSALDAVLADIAARGIGTLVNLGDCLSGPFDAVGTAERLMTLGLPTVMGNHDRALIDRPAAEMGLWERWIIDELRPEHLAWLRSFPKTLEVEGVLLCHGSPRSDDEDWLDVRGPGGRMVEADREAVVAAARGVEQRVILCGHTHTPRICRLEDGRMVVNPGSVGCPAYLDNRFEPAFAHETGSPDAAYAILTRDGSDWRAEQVQVPYDPAPMVARARTRGGSAESWVQAVETGRVTPPRSGFVGADCR